MQEISVLNNEIDLNCTENYRLSIQLCLNGFSFGIKDDTIDEFLLLKYYPFTNRRAEYLIDNLKLILTKEPILLNKFKNTNIILQSEKKTIIPEKYYSEDSMGEIFNTSNTIGSNELLLVNKEFETSNYIVFSIAKDLHQFLIKSFKNCNIVSSIIPLIQDHSQINNNYRINIFIDNATANYYDIVAYDGDKIVLVNTQRYITDMDIAYYILNTIKSINAENCECNIILTGNYRDESEAILLLKKQIKSVSFATINKNRKEFKNNEIDNIFKNILNYKECESLVEHIKVEE